MEFFIEFGGFFNDVDELLSDFGIVRSAVPGFGKSVHHFLLGRFDVVEDFLLRGHVSILVDEGLALFFGELR